MTAATSSQCGRLRIQYEGGGWPADDSRGQVRHAVCWLVERPSELTTTWDLPIARFMDDHEVTSPATGHPLVEWARVGR
ncbi:unnamed protein product [Soboliphyme baturini]|uniref:Chromo domain-containing protein n=1 Tax=Soboliphyme baturini TaxID=241478 RepID=A0A183IDH4_9BILA|nr:unnamed protein product [Soboliphyme baturini]